MNTTIVVGRIVLGMSTAALSQNLITNGDSAAKTVLGTNMDASNLSRSRDGPKTALAMSSAVSNQSPIAAGLENGTAIIAAKTTCRARAAAMRIAARGTTITEGSGRGKADRAVALAMIIATGLTNDP